MFSSKKSTLSVYRIVAFILSMIFCVSLLSFSVPAKVSYDDIKNDESEEIRKRYEALAAQKAEIEKKISDAKINEADAVERKQLYDEMHNLYAEQLTMLEREKKQLEYRLSECREDAERLEAEYQKSYDNFIGLLRMTYEEGSASYFEIILGAKNFGDLLSRIERVSGMIGYNDRLMDKVKEAESLLAEKKEELDGAMQKLADSQEKVIKKQDELDRWDEENALLLEQLADQIENDKATADMIDLKWEAVGNELTELINKLVAAEEERLRKIEEELRQQRLAEEERKRLELELLLEEERRRQVDAEEYMWPLPVNYRTITSWFNEERNLVEIGRKDTHGGMDIAAPNKTEIYAVKTGRVLLSGFVSGYGNCVMIDHGNGVVSVYGHASRLMFRAGDIVHKGDVIALVGLTGDTTGYHLHIEFRKNGARDEPLNYISLPQY